MGIRDWFTTRGRGLLEGCLNTLKTDESALVGLMALTQEDLVHRAEYKLPEDMRYLAEDVANEVFARLWKYRSNFVEGSSPRGPGAYILRVLTNTLKDTIRARRTLGPIGPQLTSELLHTLEYCPDTGHDVITTMDRRILESQINRESRKRRYRRWREQAIDTFGPNPEDWKNGTV